MAGDNPFKLNSGHLDFVLLSMQDSYINTATEDGG